jgi:hypothetical protein
MKTEKNYMKIDWRRNIKNAKVEVVDTWFYTCCRGMMICEG